MNNKKLWILASILGTNVAISGGMGPVSTDFSGFYAGLGTGAMTELSANKASFPVNPTGTVYSSDQWLNSATGVLFDGHIGYGRVFSSQYYLGVKGSIDYPFIQQHDSTAYAGGYGTFEANGVFNNTIYFKPIYNIDGVLGYQMTPNWLSFFEAGVTFSNVVNRESITSSTIILPTNINNVGRSLETAQGYNTGYNLGLGASYLMTPNVFVSGEVLYSYFGKYTQSHQLAPATRTIQQTYQGVSAMVSVSYLWPNM